MIALTVDDDPAMRNFLRRILVKDFGYNVVEAENGLQALGYLEKQSFDVAFVDLFMPIIDGVELLRELRSTPRHDAMAVIVLTAMRDEKVVRDVLQLGVDGFLVKSGEVDRMRARLSRLLMAGTGSTGPAPKPLTRDSAVLVVDQDEDFRHFCMDVFSPRCRVAATDSAAEVLMAGQGVPPDLILIGEDVGVIRPEFMARKLRDLCPPTSTRLVAAVQRDRVRATKIAGLYDHVVARSFVPDVFLAQFTSMFEQANAMQRVLAVMPSLRSELAKSIEQVMGVMVQAEAWAVASSEQHADGTVARVPLDVPERGEALRLTIRIPQATGTLLAERITGAAPADITAEDVASVLQEIANIAGGRLQAKLSSAGCPARLGLPVCESVGAGPVVADGDSAVSVSLEIALGEHTGSVWVALSSDDGSGVQRAVA
ncbi:MAG: response regulator [Vicinamibacterales bacterium]